MGVMNPIIIFYSRSGNTRKVAQELSAALGCQVVEILDRTKRSGVIGYMRSIRQASAKKEVEIEDVDVDLKKFDMVIIGTPVWMYTVSTPVRAFLTRYGACIEKAAFFCTHGGNPGHVWEDMEGVLGKAPIAKMDIFDNDLKAGNHDKAVDAFLIKVKE